VSAIGSRALRGFVAGVAGTLTMAGAAFVVRRMVQPSAQIGMTHYESVVEWASGKAGGGGEMEPADRVRAGELLHLAFGGFWGAVFSILSGGRDIRPFTEGLIYGTLLWIGAFGGYMPALGISKSITEMGNYERGRTFVAHVMFAVGTLSALKAINASD
jgi:hypothetical protein